MRSKLSITLVAGALALAPAIDRAQEPPAGPEAAAAAWLDLVAGGQGGVAWHQTDPYFQARIPEAAWESWVGAQRGRLPGRPGRQLLESATGRNATVEPPVDWAIYVFATNRPAGGRIIQRVAVARAQDGGWAVYDYGVWPDPAAIVANASVDPIPYGAIPLYGGRWGRFRRLPGRPDGRPAPPSGRNVANPRTAPPHPSPSP
jgi:Protein of unknown function (DUF4019)